MNLVPNPQIYLFNSVLSIMDFAQDVNNPVVAISILHFNRVVTHPPAKAVLLPEDRDFAPLNLLEG